jgi:hypothetical protein
MKDPLATYLHDHLGGARTAIELLQAMRDHEKGTPLGEFAAYLLAEVEADRDTLQRLADKIGAGPSVLKEVTGWLGEKATRVKLGQSAEDEFSTFQSLEFLALGVLGKGGLWKALDVAAASDQRLGGYDFKQLASSAQMQYEKVERQRLELAETALKPAKLKQPSTFAMK